MNFRIDPDSCALITIDLQKDFSLLGAPATIPGTLQIIPKVREWLEYFRGIDAPIIHMIRLYLPDGSNADRCRRDRIRSGIKIVTPGTDGAELVNEIKPISQVQSLNSSRLLQGKVEEIGKNEYVIYKPRWGAFYQTPLEKFLKSKRINSLVFCGCNFPNCPRTSIYEASERDFEIALVSDAVSALYDKAVQELKEIGVYILDSKYLADLYLSKPSKK